MLNELKRIANIKIFRIFLIFNTLIFIGAFSDVFAYDFSAVNGSGVTIYYNISYERENAVEVTYENDPWVGPPSYSGNIIIPSSVSYAGQIYVVVAIDDYAFQNCSGLTGITLPNTLEWIDNNAFYGCQNLTSIILPNSTTMIRDWAFSFSGVTSLEVSPFLTSISNNAFAEATNFDGFHVDPNNPRYLSVDSVLYTKNQDTIECFPNHKPGHFVIPRTVTAIDDYAYYGCGALYSLTIPTTVTSIGNYSFGNFQLTNLEIPTSVKTIGNSAFIYSALSSVTIPEGVQSVGASCFWSSNISIVTIPKSLETIGTQAFSCCYNLQTISVDADNQYYSSNNGVLYNKQGDTLIRYPAGIHGGFAIPNGVKTIGVDAFQCCSYLTDITFPTTLNSIWDISIFSSCVALQNIYVDAENERYSSLNGVLYSKNQDTLLCYPQHKEGSFDMPSSVMIIGHSAFWNCDYLTDITMPNSLKVIGYNAFYSCDALQIVTIPSSVDTIEGAAFCYCYNLQTVNMLDSTTYISEGVFSGCSSLRNIVIPASVMDIYYDAFNLCSSLSKFIIPSEVNQIGVTAFANCTGLDTIYSYAIHPPTIDSMTFLGVNKSLVLIVSCGSVNEYQNTPYWNEFTNIQANPNYKYYSTMADTICQGEHYYFFDRVLDTAGIYIDTLETEAGCDSIITLNLYVNPAYEISQYDTICEGGVFYFAGRELTEEGTYTDQLTAVNGCDSTIILHLVVHPNYNVTLSDTITRGDVFDFNSRLLTEAGVYVDSLQSINGCDSIVTQEIIRAPLYTTIDAVICEGQIYSDNNFEESTAGTYVQTLTSSTGEDSIITLNLIVFPVFTDSVFAEIYAGDTFTDYGFNAYETGIYMVSYADINGCDSTYILDLKVYKIKIPNVVTANGDGINDIMEIDDILDQDLFTHTELTIVNRYGKLIYHVENIKEKSDFWDPNATNTPTGTYFYRFIARSKKKSLQWNGVIEVIR